MSPGNARNSITLQSLGDAVRMVTGANALQLMGHNDNGWDQGQIMVLPNASILSPYGMSNKLLKATFQPTVVSSAVDPAGLTDSTELFFLATTNKTAMNFRIANLNTSAVPLHITWKAEVKGDVGNPGGDTDRAEVRCFTGETARVQVLGADSLDAVNTPAQPNRVGIADGAPLAVVVGGVSGSLQYVAPKLSVTVITVEVGECVQT